MTKVSTVTAVSRHSLFGPPPFLEEEDAAAYDEIYGRVCAAVKPVDIIDEILTADIASLQVEVSGWRRCKSSRIRERGLAALEQFLCKELEYQHYQNRFADDLTEILRSHVPKHNADEAARLLARACAQIKGLPSTRSTKFSTALVTAWITCCNGRSATRRKNSHKSTGVANRPPSNSSINCSPPPAGISTLSRLRRWPRNSTASNGSTV